MKMTRVLYRENPLKFTDFQQVSEGQIINAFSKLRRIGYSDKNIIDACKILLSKVPDLKGEDEQ